MKNVVALIVLCTAFSLNLMAQIKFLPSSSAPTEAQALYGEGVQALNNWDQMAYMAKMKEAIMIDSTFFLAYANGTFVAIIMGQGDYSINLIRKGLAIDPANFNKGEKILRKALVKLESDRSADLSEEMDALVKAYPDNNEAYMYAVMECFLKGNFEKGLGLAESLTSLDPSFPEGYNMLGYCYMNTDQMDKAKTAFEKYVELLPDAANPYDSMGEYYMKAKEYEKSAEFYQKAFDMGMRPAGQKAEKAKSMIKK